MKKSVVVFVFTAFAMSAGFVLAQEPADLQLEFIHQLRKKGLADLALTYIENLQKNPPPQLAAILPLEAARTRVALSQGKQPEDRAKLLSAALKELETYLGSKKGTDEAPQLKLEIARVSAYQGQALLGQALRQEDAKFREDFGKKARDQFIEAQKKYDEAIKDMDDLLKKYKGPDAKKEAEFKKQLGADLLAGKFDRAKTIVFEARSILDPDDKLTQAKLYDTAKKALQEVALDNSKTNEEVRWLAVVWYIDVGRRGGEGTKPLDQYKKLMEVNPSLVPEVGPAQRLAHYIYIQAVRIGDFPLKDDKKLNVYLAEECTKWLIQYKKYQNTPEGLGVQFELAHAYLGLATSQKDPSYKNKDAKKLYDLAQQHFDVVANSHSDLSEPANQESIKIKVLRIGETPIEALKVFDDCFLKARYEMYQMKKVAEAIKKLMGEDLPKEQMEKEMKVLKGKQKSHLKAIIASFNRALDVATPLTPPNKVDEARFFLAYTYLVSGDFYRGAVMADYLARKESAGKHGPLAANYGLQAYEQVLKKHNDPANQERLFGLANYVLTDRAADWKDQPVTAIAQYALALFYMRQKENPKEYIKSLDYLEKLPKDFRAYTFAQCQLALISLAISADAAKEQDTEKAQAFRLKALFALRKIPTLPDKADPATAAMFFTAQLNQGTILYNNSIAYLKEGKKELAEADLKLMVTFTKDLLKQFDKFKDQIDPKVSEKLEGALSNLDKFARYGETRIAYQKAEYDKVLSKDFTGDIIAKLAAEAKAKGELVLADFAITGDLLGLALRAHVQKGQFKEAEKVLDLVQKLKNPNALDDKSNPTASLIMQNLLADLSNQIKILKKEGDDKKLKETIKNFSTFFDALVAGKSAETLSYNDLVFLATCYASVDQHEKAAKMYSDLPPPKLVLPPNATKDEKAKAEADHKKAEAKWWFLQVRCGEEWRLAKDFKKAKDTLNKVLDEPKAAGKIQAFKELSLVYEDEGSFSKAVKSWNDLMNNPSIANQMKNPATQKIAREIYYDSRYHLIYCIYMFSQNDGKKKEDEYVATAAKYIWKLELDHKQASDANKKKGLEPPTDTGWTMIGGRLTELMDNAPKLKEEYKKQKAAASK